MTAVIIPESNTRASTSLDTRPLLPAWHADSSSVQGPLRIAQLAPPFEAIPPRAYGGTERVVSVLTEELVRRGHHVTLFASGDSQTAARLVPTTEVALWRRSGAHDPQAWVSMAMDKVYRRAHEFDVIHNHLDYQAFPAARATPGTPTLTTLHGRLDLPHWPRVFHQFAEMPLVSISDAQRLPSPTASWAATIHHGLDLRPFEFHPRPGKYLAFLGRISPEKGLDTAIAVARRVGMPLKIAARMPLDQPNNAEAQRDWRYYRELIEPHLSDPGIEYVGEATEATKSEFLGNAAALLFPIRWPEPFGLVMIEALACGTPVIALRCGSAPEVIEDGVTGFVVDDEAGLVHAVGRLPELSRRDCRMVAETRFSAATMAEQYERVFRSLLGQTAPPAHPGTARVPAAPEGAP